MKTLLGLMLCFGGLVTTALAASDKAALRAELVRTETEFCALAQAKGIAAAFAHFAAADAVFFDVDPQQHRGPAAVARKFAGLPPGTVLTWQPVAADVADSGDLGYTWGTYEHRGAPGPDGKVRVSTGHYVTVWKRQADGTWRFVLDTGNPKPPAKP